MYTADFMAPVVNGTIRIPESLQRDCPDQVRVVLMDSGAASDPSSWPARNRRRLLLVVKQLREGLTEGEAAELAALEHEADRELQDVGALPIEELENLYSQLSQQDR